VASPKTIIRGLFPKIAAYDFTVTSNPTLDYNCIGWAAEQSMDRWWWPLPQYYWPAGFPLDVTVENFIAVFKAFGYESCDSLQFESGFEKVALYIQNGRPTHMARQLANGKWTSKLGDLWDIEHKTVFGLEGQRYGAYFQVLCRPTTTT
jgi:hypothetical protein